jgi:hypothetical protein
LVGAAKAAILKKTLWALAQLAILTMFTPQVGMTPRLTLPHWIPLRVDSPHQRPPLDNLMMCSSALTLRWAAWPPCNGSFKKPTKPTARWPMTADGARARAEQEAEAFDPFEGMTQDQLDNLDPAVVDAMRRAARKSLATTLSKVQDPAAMIEKAMAERDNRRLRSYIKQISEELNLQAVADDPQFNAYAQEHGSADMLVSSLLQSATVDIAQALKPRVTKMLAGFQTWKTGKKSADAQPDDPTSRTPGSYASRGPAGSGSGSQRRVVNGPADMARLRAEHAAATRRRDFKEAKRLLDIINA